MFLYSYTCGCGNYFEALSRMDERHDEPCPDCGGTALMKIEPIRLDPNMDTPGANFKWRKQAERRGRGADMTTANKNVEDYVLRRDAHSKRVANGEGKIIKT